MYFRRFSRITRTSVYFCTMYVTNINVIIHEVDISFSLKAFFLGYRLAVEINFFSNNLSNRLVFFFNLNLNNSDSNSNSNRLTADLNKYYKFSRMKIFHNNNVSSFFLHRSINSRFSPNYIRK